MNKKAHSSGQMHVNIVGAGIAGLSAALLAARSGFTVDVFERNPHAGGLLHPIEFDGLMCDQGSHRVHPQSHPLLRELTQQAGWQKRPRRGRLVLGGRLIPYPPTPLRFLQGLGMKTSALMAMGWVTRPRRLKRVLRWEDDRRSHREDEGFESFVRGRVGHAAYECFYKPYAVKVWGGDPNQLSQTVAKQRVSTSSPLPTLLGLARQNFLYPQGGMASLVEYLHSEAKAADVRFHFSRSFSLSDASSDPVLYSGHLPELVSNSGLEYKGLYLLHLQVPADAVGAVDTWYAPETEFWFGRVSQPAQFSSVFKRDKRTVLCVEIPEGDWGQGQDFIQKLPTIMRQLRQAKILNHEAACSLAHQSFLPRIYPMYRRGWLQSWCQAMDRVGESGNIFPFGRQGLFLHCNMDHAVETAADLVQHVRGGGSSESWALQCRKFLSVRVRD